jgi:methanogenic corrinoid protein MtbC1
MPTRSEGGQRQYTEEDVQSVKWLLARKEEGMSISRAVELWQSMQAEGANPLQDARFGGAGGLQHRGGQQSLLSAEEFKDRWVSACLEFDEESAERVIREAFSLFELQVVCLDVPQDGLIEIGEMWYVGKVTVQQEHFASALAVRRLNAMIAASVEPSGSKKVVIATPSNEEHIISSLILTLLLRQSGHRVVYLGAEVPTTGMKIMINIIRPDLVVLSSSHVGSLPDLMDAANYLADAGIAMAYGGRVFNVYDELQGLIPGEFLGDGLIESRQRVEQLLAEKATAAEKRVIDAAYVKSQQVFTNQRAAIEQAVIDEMADGASVEFQQNFVGDNIAASLSLGLSEPIAGELDWAKGYVEQFENAGPTLADYVSSYRTATEALLDEGGETVSEWLAQAEIYLAR